MSARDGPAWRRKLGELFGLDLRSLAVFRIGLGLLLLTDLAGRVTDLQAHYTDAGVLPRSALVNPWPLSLHCLSGEVWLQGLLFAAAAGFALALLLGWHTRLATFASWFLLLSLHARNPLVLQGGDVLLRLLLFWGMFLPLGACWSLDRRAGRAAPTSDYRVVSGGGVALLLQICFVYWSGAALKSDPVWWRDGTAVYYALSIDAFATPLGRFLLGFPQLLKVLTFATLLLEAGGPLLLFIPFRTGPVRTAVVAAFLGFHLFGLNLCMELGPFPYICAVAWLALLPGWFWNTLGRRVRFLAAAPASGRPDSVQPAWWVHVFAGVLAAFVLVWNLGTVFPVAYNACVPPGGAAAQAVNAVGPMFGLDQFWGMFAPFPLREDGWYVIPGTLKDGRTVDLFQDGQPVSWDKPAWVSATYKSERWRKYHMNLCQVHCAPFRAPYAGYLCRSWNARHSGDEELQRLEMVFVMELTLPDNQTAPPKQLLLCAHECGDGCAWEH